MKILENGLPLPFGFGVIRFQPENIRLSKGNLFGFVIAPF